MIRINPDLDVVRKHTKRGHFFLYIYIKIYHQNHHNCENRRNLLVIEADIRPEKKI